MTKELETGGRLFSRRELIRTGALAAGAATLSGLSAGRAAPAEATGPARPVKNMHLSMVAYSMRDALTKGGMDLFGFIDWCAELNLAGTDLTAYYFRKEIDNDYLHQLKLHAFRKGVTISGTAVGNEFCLPPGAKRQEQLDYVRKWIDYAVEMGAPHVRIFAGHQPEGVDLKTCLGWVVEGIKLSLDYASRKGVVLGLENHGGVTEKLDDLLTICAGVGDNPWFGINLDTGNFQTDDYSQLAAVAPRAVNVHIKVDRYDTAGNKHPADLEKVRDILAAAGYKGWLALEFEGEGDPNIEIPKVIRHLQELFEGC